MASNAKVPRSEAVPVINIAPNDERDVTYGPPTKG